MGNHYSFAIIDCFTAVRQRTEGVRFRTYFLVYKNDQLDIVC
jgi:hypothetical protein